MIFKKYTVLFFFLCSFSVFSSVNQDDSNYEKGKYYALKYKDNLALPYLKKSADTGNADAMFRYALLVNVQHGLFLNAEAFEYVEMAAEKGHEWAMMLLARENYSGLSKKESENWRKKFDDRLEPYLDDNNKDALYIMHQMEFDDREKWLEKAAEAGSDEAMIRLAAYYHDHGWFILGAREERIEELREAAYKLGNHWAILIKGSTLISEGMIEQGENEWGRLIDSGDAEAISQIARYYFKKDLFPEVHNLEKSARLMKIYVDSMGMDERDSMSDYFEKKYQEIYPSLTPQQQQRVDQWVTDYLATHDVLAPDTVWETKFK